jgi:orotidine-5'-phosphate decarboxylase
LIQACKDKGGPICVGIDPVWEKLPSEVHQWTESKGLVDYVNLPKGEKVCEVEKRVLGLLQFCLGVIDAVAEHVPCIKIQSACFERYQTHGSEVLHTLINYARNAGLIVVTDGKRNDIGISASHYAAGCLADPSPSDYSEDAAPMGPDALTINSYLGSDGVTPFTDVGKDQGKGLFTLVRTSNPSGDALQSLELASGGTVAQAMAKIVAELGAADGLVGESGYSLLGAVVGATKASDAARLRELMPQQIFLVPGFGAQGGSADDVKACFNGDGQGAIITASRSVIYAHEKNSSVDWEEAVEQAAIEMKQQVNEAIQS